MVDEEMALNQSGEETAPVATPAAEEQTPGETEQVEEPSAQDEAETETAETEGKSKPKKKGVDARIGELTKKVKRAEAEKQTLAEKLKEVTSQFGIPAQEPETMPSAVDEPIVRPGEEIDGFELEKRLAARDQRLLQRARAEINFRDQVNKVTDNINREARQAVDTYPELDAKSEHYDPDLSATVTEATEAFVKSNPTGSVKQFVDKLMKPYKRAVTKEVGEARENIAKQVSQQAMRPTSAPKGGAEAKEKSLNELEKELGVVY